MQVPREERTFRVNMFVEWCVLISVQVRREEHTFQVNMSMRTFQVNMLVRTFQVNISVEWCVLIRLGLQGYRVRVV